MYLNTDLHGLTRTYTENTDLHGLHGKHGLTRTYTDLHGLTRTYTDLHGLAQRFRPRTGGKDSRISTAVGCPAGTSLPYVKFEALVKYSMADSTVFLPLLLLLGAGGGVKTDYPDVLSYCTAQAHP